VSLPDLSTCEFFLYSYPKKLASYLGRIQRANLREKRYTSQNAAENLRSHLHQCIAAGGHHLPDVIFKT